MFQLLLVWINVRLLPVEYMYGTVQKSYRFVHVNSFHRNCKAVCSHFVSVMSMRKKSNNSDGHTQNIVWFSLQTRRVYYALVVSWHYINYKFWIEIFEIFLEMEILKKGWLWSWACYFTWRWSVTYCIKNLIKKSVTFTIGSKKIFFLMQEVVFSL